jgi:hypothetical protein
MILLQQSRRILTALILVIIVTFTGACSSNVAQVDRTSNPPVIARGAYAELERGNTASGESFGNWVVQASKGLIQDAYVRDNNKLGVVISPKVRPNEVRELTKSLMQGFHKNFPDQDLKVLVYAPDKKLILTADFDKQSNQLQYT